MMIEALDGMLPSRARVLDLGCGTGSLSERVLGHFPRAKVVAVDRDPVLLAIGRAALGNRGDRLTWIDADLRDPKWTEQLPRGRYDAVVTSTALHWLTAAELGRLYRAVGRRLRPGGLFLNGDSIRARRPHRRLFRILERGARRREGRGSGEVGESWSDWWHAALTEPTLAEEAALHRARFPRSHHGTRTADLTGHVRSLRRAGFREVAVIWSRGRSRVLAAVR